MCAFVCRETVTHEGAHTKERYEMRESKCAPYPLYRPKCCSIKSLLIPSRPAPAVNLASKFSLTSYSACGATERYKYSFVHAVMVAVTVTATAPNSCNNPHTHKSDNEKRAKTNMRKPRHTIIKTKTQKKRNFTEIETRDMRSKSASHKHLQKHQHLLFASDSQTQRMQTKHR